jgi:hypothetical protein
MLHQVEPAKSNRSKCNKKSKKDPCAHGGSIAKGHVRIGSWNEDVGSYSWFVHLECWRVPAKIWLAFGASPNVEQIRASMHLLDSVSICGFSEMPPEQQDTFITHVMNKDNWARAPAGIVKSETQEQIPTILDDETKVKTARKAKAKAPRSQHSAEMDLAQDATAVARVAVKNEEALAMPMPASASAESALVARAATPQKRGGAFVMPIPGQNGSLPNAMAGLIVVLTGL